MRAIEHRHLLQLLSLTLNHKVVLNGLNGMHLHIGIESWLLRADSERVGLRLVSRDVFVNVIHAFFLL